MSLKAFHIFFVSVSILLTVVFGMWEIHAYQEDGSGNLWMGFGSFAVTVLLVFYLRWFLKKLSKERYL
jgi:hypothetical protein